MLSAAMRSVRQLTPSAASKSQTPSSQGIYANQEGVQRACDAIGRRPRDAKAYNLLGDAIGENELAPTLRAMEGEPLTKKECYRKAAELDLNNAHAFYHLGLLLSRDEEIKVANEPLDKKACFIKAAELNPGNADAFRQLGRLLSPNEIIDVGGKSLTKEDCLGKKKGRIFPFLSFNRTSAPASSTSDRANSIAVTGNESDLYQERARRAIPETQGNPDNADASKSQMRDSDDVPILEDTSPIAARADSQMRESYTIPTLEDGGDIGSREVSTADLEPEFAENLDSILRQDDGYKMLVEILQNAKRLNDIATNPDLEHLTARHYMPPEGNVRTYYQAFNQAMECMFCTAQAVMSGLIPIKKSGALSAANLANRTIHLGMPNVISAGLLCLVKQKQETKTLNNLGKILRFFQDADQLKHVTRDVSKAICITQENALNQYEEAQDAAAKSDIRTMAKTFARARWFSKPAAPPENAVVAAAEKRAKKAELQADPHLEASSMGRKALRDIHQILDAIILLSDEKFEELKRLEPYQRKKAMVTLMKKALHVQDPETDDEETKRPVPGAGESSTTGVSSGFTDREKHLLQQVQQLQQLFVEFERRLQEQNGETKALKKQVGELQKELAELKRTR